MNLHSHKNPFLTEKMVKKGCYGNECFGLAWDRTGVRQTNLFITSCLLSPFWACYEIKKSVGRTFDTSRWHLKLLGEKISTYWESWFSRIGQNVHLSDVHDRFEVIKIFNLFLYSIEINLFKHIRSDKMWSRTVGELNLNWTMHKY